MNLHERFRLGFVQNRNRRKVWVTEFKRYIIPEVKHQLKYAFALLVGICPDCKKVDNLLWFEIGNHEDCIPF